MFQCLSLGTPVISERTPDTRPPAIFEDSVFWVPTGEVRAFFASEFRSPDFLDAARDKLQRFRKHDVLDQYAQALAQMVERRAASATPEHSPWRPSRLHIGSGKNYMPGWFNVDILASAEPDARIDLSRPIELPIHLESDTVGAVELSPGSLELIYTNNVLEHVADLAQLMTNCLRLLRDGGQMLAEVPYERAVTAWQDPTHVRALNENSWFYYTDWFWYLGWFESRFAIVKLDYLDGNLAECQREGAHFMRVRLQKVPTTATEKMTARAMRADFGGIPADDL